LNLARSGGLSPYTDNFTAQSVDVLSHLLASVAKLSILAFIASPQIWHYESNDNLTALHVHQQASLFNVNVAYLSTTNCLNDQYKVIDVSLR